MMQTKRTRGTKDEHDANRRTGNGLDEIVSRMDKRGMHARRLFHEWTSKECMQGDCFVNGRMRNSCKEIVL